MLLSPNQVSQKGMSPFTFIQSGFYSSKKKIPPVQTSIWLHPLTSRLALPSLQLGEDAGVNETEEVPLGGGLGLEVPPEPALGFLLEDVELGVDVFDGVGLVLRGPLVDVVDGGAATDIVGAEVGTVSLALAVGAVVAGTDAVTVLFFFCYLGVVVRNDVVGLNWG